MKGYLIYHSEKYIISLGSHSFECSNGSNILFEYVCDGILDCPADASDEDSCMCNTSSYSKECKTMTSKNDLITCSSLYYMTKDGHCLKFTHPERMYDTLNIIHDLHIYRAKITSKLIPFDEFENNYAYEGISQMNISFTNLYTKQFKCLNPGELPCGRKHYECFNITSMCIYQLNRDNYLIPCKNGRHLEHCQTFMCDSMLKCTTVYCIPWSYVCNGRWDCPQGDDESSCNNLKACKNMFHCKNTNMDVFAFRKYM